MTSYLFTLLLSAILCPPFAMESSGRFDMESKRRFSLADPAPFVMNYGRVSDDRLDTYRRMNVTELQILNYKLEDLISRVDDVVKKMKTVIEIELEKSERKRKRYRSPSHVFGFPRKTSSPNSPEHE